MVDIKWMFLLVGGILGIIFTSFGYHKLFSNFQDTIDDLKETIRGKNMVIQSWKNFNEQKDVTKPE